MSVKLVVPPVGTKMYSLELSKHDCNYDERYGIERISYGDGLYGDYSELYSLTFSPNRILVYVNTKQLSAEQINLIGEKVFEYISMYYEYSFALTFLKQSKIFEAELKGLNRGIVKRENFNENIQTIFEGLGAYVQIMGKSKLNLEISRQELAEELFRMGIVHIMVGFKDSFPIDLIVRDQLNCD